MNDMVPVAAILALAAIVIFAPRECQVPAAPDRAEELELVPAATLAEEPRICTDPAYEKLCWMAQHGPEEVR